MKLLIKNGTVVTHEREEAGISILVEDGKIAWMGKDSLPEADQVIDAQGLYVLPGLVDAHCHLRDPGFEYKEDIRSGTISAARGGFTSVACMPNTKPVIDNKTVVRYIVDKAKQEGVVNVFPIGSITKGLDGSELAEMGSMKEAGIVAVSDDGRPVLSPSVMKKAMIYANMFGLKVISHCEDLDLADGGSMNEGEISTKLGLRGIPTIAEDLMVAREVLLSEYTGIPIHIAHVSTERSVALIREAKNRGVEVTCETCPHYFTLTENACEDYDTNTKMNPPLRTEKDRLAIIEGLRDGTIDIIATDHAPHHYDEKNVEFESAPNGIVGFESALPLAITYLVEPGVLTMTQLVKKISQKPAQILGIDKGSLTCGKDADIVIIDKQQAFTLDAAQFASKSKNSPFTGFKVTGQVKYTLVNGKIIHQQNA